MEFFIGIAMIYAISKIAKHYKFKYETDRQIRLGSGKPNRNETRRLLLANRDLKKRVENLEYIVTSLDKEVLEAASFNAKGYKKASDVARLKRMLDEV